MELKTLVAKLEALSTNLEVAQTVRERVRIADRIYEALSEIEQRVETFVVKEIGQPGGVETVLKAPSIRITPAKGRFRESTIAEGGKILLKEHGVLHGKEIERLLKEDGYRSNSDKFQNTMVVAFRRDGGFENIGGNRWKLKDGGLPFTPQRFPREEREANENTH